MLCNAFGISLAAVVSGACHLEKSLGALPKVTDDFRRERLGELARRV